MSMVGTGLGFLAMPQAVQLLLEEYSFPGAVLILGGIALHSIVGSMVLQPIKWHLKAEKHMDVEDNKQDEYKVRKNSYSTILKQKCQNGRVLICDM
jgi:hypothetical protein